MNLTVASYLVYLAVAVPLTVWVAGVLSRNGRVFLEDVFSGNDRLAGAVNTLLVVGFYLLNLGFVVLYLRAGSDVGSARELLETLSVKIGTVTLVLGVVHFLNVYVFSAIRRRSRTDQLRAQRPPYYGPPPGYFVPAPGPAPQPGPARP